MHRFTVLKMHYINEMANAQGNNLIQEEINKKYTIPCKALKLDHVKTYCNYILNRYSDNRSYVELELDENYEPTGKSKVVIDEQEKVFNDEQLLNYTRKNLQQAILHKDRATIKKNLINDINKNPMFKQFYIEKMQQDKVM